MELRPLQMARPQQLAAIFIFATVSVKTATSDDECDFEEVDTTNLTLQFLEEQTRPVILLNITDRWKARETWPTIEAFAQMHGNDTGYARDHDQLEIRDVDMTVAEYLAGAADPTINSSSPIGPSASFFVNDYDDTPFLDVIRDQYAPPVPLELIESLRVFSLEREGAGVTFHRHTEAWQGQLLGKKRWYVFPPAVEAVPIYTPCRFNAAGGVPQAEECVIGPGQTLYIPPQWWHATCSLPGGPSLAVGGVGSMNNWDISQIAARRGNFTIMKNALEGNKEHSAVGKSVLYIEGLSKAAEYGHFSVVKKLLKMNISPNLLKDNGRNAIHEAARRGSRKMLRTFKKMNALLKLADKNHTSTLHHALAERGSFEAAEFLLEHGGLSQKDVRKSDKWGVLHFACSSYRNPVPVMRMLLERYSVSPSSVDAAGVTPLMLCARRGHAKAVGLLLKFGGEGAAFGMDNEGKDALDHALEGRSDAGVVDRLLRAGLPAEGRMQQALGQGDVEVMRHLHKAGASFEGMVVAAAEVGQLDAVKFLLNEMGLSADEQAESNKASALHMAALHGFSGMVRELLDAGAPLDQVDEDGLSPLHYACTSKMFTSFRQRKRVIEELTKAEGLRASALWSARDNTGGVPMHYAAANADTELVTWLVKERGPGDLAVRDAGGNTAVAHAKEARNEELATAMERWIRNEL